MSEFRRTSLNEWILYYYDPDLHPDNLRWGSQGHGQGVAEKNPRYDLNHVCNFSAKRLGLAVKVWKWKKRDLLGFARGQPWERLTTLGWVMVEAWRQLQYKCILYIAWMFEAGHTQSEWESQQKDGEAGLNLSVERFSPTLEKALWVKGKAWRQKQTSGEVSDQL